MPPKPAPKKHKPAPPPTPKTPYEQLLAVVSRWKAPWEYPDFSKLADYAAGFTYIAEHGAELDLTKEQFAALVAAVVKYDMSDYDDDCHDMVLASLAVIRPALEKFCGAWPADFFDAAELAAVRAVCTSFHAKVLKKL